MKVVTLDDIINAATNLKAAQEYLNSIIREYSSNNVQPAQEVEAAPPQTMPEIVIHFHDQPKPNLTETIHKVIVDHKDDFANGFNSDDINKHLKGQECSKHQFIRPLSSLQKQGIIKKDLVTKGRFVLAGFSKNDPEKTRTLSKRTNSTDKETYEYTWKTRLVLRALADEQFEKPFQKRDLQRTVIALKPEQFRYPYEVLVKRGIMIKDEGLQWRVDQDKLKEALSETPSV